MFFFVKVGIYCEIIRIRADPILFVFEGPSPTYLNPWVFFLTETKTNDQRNNIPTAKQIHYPEV